MASNKNYKYNAFAKQEEEARRAAQKKRNRTIIIITAVIVLLAVTACIVTAVILNQPKDYCGFYLERDVEGRRIHYVEMKIEGYEQPVIILLDQTSADRTVKNFLKLVGEGFYDGLTFHRIIPGFMIQGGDPEADGTGDSEDTIIGEFLANSITSNDLLHKRGVISMARGESYNSASCQFFICDADAPHLDGSYAAFGYVLEGMFTIDAVIADYKGYVVGSNGQIPKNSTQPVIEYIKVLESYEAN